MEAKYIPSYDEGSKKKKDKEMLQTYTVNLDLVAGMALDAALAKLGCFPWTTREWSSSALPLGAACVVLLLKVGQFVGLAHQDTTTQLRHAAVEPKLVCLLL